MALPNINASLSLMQQHNGHPLILPRGVVQLGAQLGAPGPTPIRPQISPNPLLSNPPIHPTALPALPTPQAPLPAPPVNVRQTVVQETLSSPLPSPLPSPPQKPSEPKEPERMTTSSGKGFFGWTTIDDVSFPYLMRDNKKFVAVRMVEMKLLSKFPSTYPDELQSKPPLMSHYVNAKEAKLLNEINAEHCGMEFGRQNFNGRDLIVKLEDFIEFYNIVRKHFPETVSKKPSKPKPPPAPTDGGWIQVNNTVVPYVLRASARYVPLSVIRYAAGLLSEVPVEGHLPTQEECAYLNENCKKAGLTFTFAKSTKLIPAEIITMKSDVPVHILDLPKEEPFSYAEVKMTSEEEMSQNAMVASSASQGFPGMTQSPLTSVSGSNVHSNMSGNMTGSMAGNISCNMAGNVGGNMASNMAGNMSGNLAGNMAGNMPRQGGPPNNSQFWMNPHMGIYPNTSQGPNIPQPYRPSQFMSQAMQMMNNGQSEQMRSYLSQTGGRSVSPASRLEVNNNGAMKARQNMQGHMDARPMSAGARSSPGELLPASISNQRRLSGSSAPTNSRSTPPQVANRTTPVGPPGWHPAMGGPEEYQQMLQKLARGQQNANAANAARQQQQQQQSSSGAPPAARTPLAQLEKMGPSLSQAGSSVIRGPTAKGTKRSPAVTPSLSRSSSVDSLSGKTPSGSSSAKSSHKDGKIKPVEFFGKTLSCLIKGPAQDSYALVEAVARVYFPYCTLDEFQFALETILKLPVTILSSEEEKAFIDFYGLPTKTLMCNKVVKLNEFELLMPKLHEIFKDKADAYAKRVSRKREKDSARAAEKKSKESHGSQSGSSGRSSASIEREAPTKTDGGPSALDVFKEKAKNVLKEIIGSKRSGASDDDGSQPPSKSRKRLEAAVLKLQQRQLNQDDSSGVDSPNSQTQDDASSVSDSNQVRKDTPESVQDMDVDEPRVLNIVPVEESEEQESSLIADMQSVMQNNGGEGTDTASGVDQDASSNMLSICQVESISQEDFGSNPEQPSDNVSNLEGAPEESSAQVITRALVESGQLNTLEDNQNLSQPPHVVNETAGGADKEKDAADVAPVGDASIPEQPHNMSAASEVSEVLTEPEGLREDDQSSCDLLADIANISLPETCDSNPSLTETKDSDKTDSSELLENSELPAASAESTSADLESSSQSQIPDDSCVEVPPVDTITPEPVPEDSAAAEKSSSDIAPVSEPQPEEGKENSETPMEVDQDEPQPTDVAEPEKSAAMTLAVQEPSASVTPDGQDASLVASVDENNKPDTVEESDVVGDKPVGSSDKEDQIVPPQTEESATLKETDSDKMPTSETPADAACEQKDEPEKVPESKTDDKGDSNVEPLVKDVASDEKPVDSDESKMDCAPTGSEAPTESEATKENKAPTGNNAPTVESEMSSEKTDSASKEVVQETESSQPLPVGSEDVSGNAKKSSSVRVGEPAGENEAIEVAEDSTSAVNDAKIAEDQSEVKLSAPSEPVNPVIEKEFEKMVTNETTESVEPVPDKSEASIKTDSVKQTSPVQPADKPVEEVKQVAPASEPEIKAVEEKSEKVDEEKSEKVDEEKSEKVDEEMSNKADEAGSEVAQDVKENLEKKSDSVENPVDSGSSQNLKESDNKLDESVTPCDTPMESDVPSGGQAPTEGQVPVEGKAPVEEQASIVEQASVEKQASIEKQASVEKQAQVEGHASVEEKSPVEEKVSTEEQVSVTEKAPVTENVSVDKSEPEKRPEQSEEQKSSQATDGAVLSTVTSDSTSSENSTPVPEITKLPAITDVANDGAASKPDEKSSSDAQDGSKISSDSNDQKPDDGVKVST